MRTIKFLLLAVVASVCIYHATAVNVVGIDFGSEWIKAGIVKAGAGVQIVLNDASKRKSPNVLGIDQDFRSFGDVAMSKPHLAYERVRALLGKKYNETYLASFPKSYFGFGIVESPERGSFGIVHQVNASQTMQPEELTAMILSFVGEMAAGHAKEAVTDVVITVPSYFTQFERQAMLDAAEIAGLNVLSLLSDHTAVALKFGIDHKVETLEKPINVLFYDMGSTSTVVSLVNFQSIPDKDAGKNKTQGQLQVRGVAWDTTLGGFTLTSLLMDTIVERSGKAAELAKRPRSMGKLRKEAEKSKQVLSANKEAMTMIESLVPDFDFKGMLNRQDLEDAASKSNYWDRILTPVKEVLEQANLKPSDVDRIEMVGGGWRVPRVQAVLREFFERTGERDLDKTLNGDESFAYGAALYAASLSTAFRLRKFSVNDITTFSVSIDIDSSSGAVDAEDDDNKEEGAAPSDDAAAAAKSGVKNIKLFKKGHKIPSKRRMRFKRDDDFVFTMKYDDPSELPPNTPTLIGTFNVSGIASAVAKYPNATKPQVNIAFRLLRDGMVEVESGEAVLEETIEVEECETPRKKATKAKKDSKSGDVEKLTTYAKIDENKDDLLSKNEFETGAKSEYSGDAAEDVVQTHVETLFVELDTDSDGYLTRLEYLHLVAPLKQTVADRIAGVNSTASDAADGADAVPDAAAANVTDSSASSENKTAEAAADEQKPVCRMKPQRRVHRAALKIVQEDGGMPPMTSKQKRASRRVLQEFEERERLQREKAQAHNDLESYTYQARDKMESSEFQAVSSEEQRTAINDALTAASTWLEEEGFTARTGDFKEQLRKLKDLIDPLFVRVYEAEARPKAIADARKLISSMTSQIKGTRASKNWLTEADAKEVEEKLAKFESWLNESVEAQESKKAHEPLSFLTTDIPSKFEPVTAAFRRFERIPKPKPAPKAKKSATADNSTATNSTDSSSAEESETSSKGSEDSKTTEKPADNEKKTEETEKKQEKTAADDDAEDVGGEATFNSGDSEQKSEL